MTSREHTVKRRGWHVQTEHIGRVVIYPRIQICILGCVLILGYEIISEDASHPRMQRIPGYMFVSSDATHPRMLEKHPRIRC